MRFSPIFKTTLQCSNIEEVFQYLAEHLNDSIRYWDYFVNWNKVIGKIKDLEIDLHTLDYLVGKPEVESAFRELLQRNGRLARLVPVLLACRECNFKILTGASARSLSYESFNFAEKENLTELEIAQICRFATKTGLLDMFRNKIIKSVRDYVAGVEVGLDSNGRKNRGGTGMETLVWTLLEPICRKNGCDLMKQASGAKIQRDWSFPLRRIDGDREFDFAIRNGNRMFLIETNYYSTNGTKLKAVAGEFQMLSEAIRAQGHEFIWITDGSGWLNCLGPLRAAFDRIDYVVNLDMILRGVLEGILLEKTRPNPQLQVAIPA